jgi:hypothetical protein
VKCAPPLLEPQDLLESSYGTPAGPVPARGPASAVCGRQIRKPAAIRSSPAHSRAADSFPPQPGRRVGTKARLDNLLKTGRPHRQKTIWDTKETGLSVLISRGPKHKRQATVTLGRDGALQGRPAQFFNHLLRYGHQRSLTEAGQIFLIGDIALLRSF